MVHCSLEEEKHQKECEYINCNTSQKRIKQIRNVRIEIGFILCEIQHFLWKI